MIPSVGSDGSRAVSLGLRMCSISPADSWSHLPKQTYASVWVSKLERPSRWSVAVREDHLLPIQELHDLRDLCFADVGRHLEAAVIGLGVVAELLGLRHQVGGEFSHLETE